MTEQHDAKQYMYRLLVYDPAAYTATTAMVCDKHLLLTVQQSSKCAMT